MINLEEERTEIEILLKNKFDMLKNLQSYLIKTIQTAEDIILEIKENENYSNINSESKTKVTNTQTKINSIKEVLRI